MKDRNCGTKATHRLISKNKYNVVHLVKLYPFSKTIGNVLALTSKTRKSGCKITSVQLGSRLNISKAKKQKKNHYKNSRFSESNITYFIVHMWYTTDVAL